MKALISPLEKVYDYEGNYLGERIAQVEPNDKIFPVAEPLYWLDCADDVNANDYYFDANTDLITKKPQPQEEKLINANEVVY